MAKITRKNATTAIKLNDLLRKRKITLAKFITDFGLHSYESLKLRCERIGVTPPDIEVYNKAKGTELINSPTDGIIVLDFPKIIKEKTGDEMLSEEDSLPQEHLQKNEEDLSVEDNVVHLSEESKKIKKQVKNKWNNPVFRIDSTEIS